MTATTAVEETILAEIKREFLGCFRYIELVEAELLYRVPLGMHGWVCVVGHPDHGSYEWVARHDASFDGDTDRFYDHSDLGYGSAPYALRDGLNNMLED